MEIKQETIHSEIYGTTRSFRIALPIGMPSDTRYNLIFVLDADYIFDIVASTAVYLQTYDYIAPTAVVAIDYSTPGNRADVGFSLNNLTLNDTGEKFYQYIHTEVRSHVEAMLPTTGFNTLVGHSYTASYLLYYLKAHAPAFTSYILFAPESTGIAPFPAGFRADTADERSVIRLLTADKDIEARTKFGESLLDRMKEAGYKDVRLDTIHSDHMAIIPDGVSSALQSLYGNYLNIDRISDWMNRSKKSVWELFSEVGQLNAQNYRQSPQITGMHLTFFLGGSHPTERHLFHPEIDGFLCRGVMLFASRSQCFGRNGRFAQKDRAIARGGALLSARHRSIRCAGGGP